MMRIHSAFNSACSGLATLAITALAILSPIPALATVVVMHDNTQEAVYDDQTNAYWYRAIGDFSNDTGSTSLAYVLNNISNLNQTAYFGIRNWHLAYFFELEALSNHSTLCRV
jgi:hypothetical protein